MITASQAYIEAAKLSDKDERVNAIAGSIETQASMGHFQAEFNKMEFLPTDFDFLHDLKYTVTSDAACIYVSWVDPKA